MIQPGTVNALVAWASGDADRIAQLVTERDALVAAFFNGGKANAAMASASANGKSFTLFENQTLSRDEKLSLLTKVLVELGEIEAGVLPPTAVYANFSEIGR